MPQTTLDSFSAAVRAEGYQEVLERKWSPFHVVGLHAHPFALKALVVQGEMWLTVGENEQHLRSGDEFTLDRDVSHQERYGAEGATLWVGRRS